MPWAAKSYNAGKTSYKRPKDRRPSSRQRGYTTTWERARRMFLRRHPLCVQCQQHGHMTPAKVVDHIRPHRGSKELFWDETNWQALCTTCHNRKTAQGQ